MEKKILSLILAVSLSGCLCACARDEDTTLTDADDEVDVSVYETSDGNIVYNYNIDGSKTESIENIDLRIHNNSEEEVSAPDGSIDIEKAEEILDGCSNYRIYLPGKIKDFKKFYNGTVEMNGKDYYSMSFYMESSGKKIFVGSDVIVACDGSAVYRVDLANAYQPVKMESADEDKEQSVQYPDASISAKDALIYAVEADREKTGLGEDLSAYTFELGEKLIVKKSISCYKITPKLTYSNSVKLGTPIYVAADGSERAFTYDSETDDYIDI